MTRFKTDAMKNTEKLPTIKVGMSDAEFQQHLKSARIDLRELIERPQRCLTILQGDEEITIGTMSNFLLIIGKAKSRKTFLCTILLAAAIASRALGLKGYLSDKVIVLFDTEQSKYHVQRTAKRILALSGVDNPKSFVVFSLRKYSPSERLIFMKRVIEETANLGIALIDGIRDSVTSINDEAEATSLVSEVLRLTEEKAFHLVAVIHENKNDKNARGHLGTELVNKAETVLSVRKAPDNKNISVVEAEYCRDKDPEPFAFEIIDGPNGLGLPQLVENWEFKTGKTKRGFTPGDLDEVAHIEIIDKIFEKNPQMRHGELSAQIKLCLAVQSIIIGLNKAKEFIQFYLNEGYIEKKGKNNSSKAYYERIQKKFSF